MCIFSNIIVIILLSFQISLAVVLPYLLFYKVLLQEINKRFFNSEIYSVK